LGVNLVRQVKVDFGGEYKEFPLGVSILLYGPVASGKTTFSLTLVREFVKNGLPCVWVSLDEGPQAVREKMDYFQIDWHGAQERNLMRFVDVYSEQITGKRIQDPYVISCSSAFNLNEINRALMKALSEVSGQGIVVFDSISTLLLYNREGTCEEFLKVHMSRITSAGHSGFFILQRDLHDPQIEETLKMMCDSVLEFGFDKDTRKISIIKLPLGSSGEWIESSLFAWQQPKGISVSRPTGPRKYLDSGGYIEEFKDGLIEGLKEGLSNVTIESKGTIGQVEGGGGQGSQTNQDGGGARGAQAQAPTVQNIEKQIIVANMSGLPDNLGAELKKLLSEQLKLRDELREKEELSRESKKKLDQLANKEQEVVHEVKQVDERTQAIMKAVDVKNAVLSRLEGERRQAEMRYQENLRKLQAAKAKAESILSRKRSLETKIHDLVEGSGELYIDLAPYLTDVISKVEAEANQSKAALEDCDVKMAATNNEIRHMSEEMQEIARRGRYVKEELEEVQTKKAKIESEFTLITEARVETENRMQQIQEAKRQMEEKLRELTGGVK
jgi:KaiC/GvpD/RAD55 family RecA-like ATPase